ncbi:hypothetical protein GCM10007884_38490 [Methylobacterium brachythecii]|uniref:Uncharacterized protein n=1 Tax=Methylobacterium brachythecii TaxID=1176177 RepID=A0ABQ6D8K2_9HYPH|nr:hypothetical protein GCM10007884_38490 [Methylobacterium brachythecii]
MRKIDCALLPFARGRPLPPDGLPVRLRAQNPLTIEHRPLLSGPKSEPWKESSGGTRGANPPSRTETRDNLRPAVK